tara:strand:+ start:145 stop:525 length:381 start_codon:yes stop_codon:yes gene_type:complete
MILGVMLVTGSAVAVIMEFPISWEALGLLLPVGVGLLIILVAMHLGADSALHLLGKPPNTVEGAVAKKTQGTLDHDVGSETIRSISVNGRAFEVSEAIFEWVSEGDEVVVSFWPRSKKVTRVDEAG